MSAARSLSHISVSDYLAGELVSQVKHEYSAGRVYAMAGARNSHNTVAGNFFAAMHRATRSGPCQPFNSGTKVRVLVPTHTRFYYPDGMVVCRTAPPEESHQDSPVVIAEVASVSTRRIDESEKRDAYLTIPTLMTYLLIDVVRARVVVYQRTERGFETVEFEGLDAVVPLDAVRTTLPLADLYERIDFVAAATEEDAIDPADRL